MRKYSCVPGVANTITYHLIFHSLFPDCSLHPRKPAMYILSFPPSPSLIVFVDLCDIVEELGGTFSLCSETRSKNGTGLGMKTYQIH